MMFVHLHRVIVAIYLVLPAVALFRASSLSVKGRKRPLRRFWLICCVGFVMSATVSGVAAAVAGGRLIPTQTIIAGYFATSLLLLINLFDRFLWLGMRWVFRLRMPRASWWFGIRAGSALVLRAAVLFGVGLPYILSATLTYRPHLSFKDDPQTLLHRSFENVRFAATDGVRLVGWWIPSEAGASTKTVLLCHGFGGGKSTELYLTSRLLAGGYNVLSFDFRGNGESNGQLNSFGDLERRDVLGAVRWVQVNHPVASRHLYGIGVNTGGAALIEAACDPGREGQSIGAVAVFGVFDRFDEQVRSICEIYMPVPMNWLAEHLGLPMASAQVGANLRTFAPAEAVKLLWPRPILVIHGIDDELVPFVRGQALYDSAFQPKYNFWIERAGQVEALHNQTAARLVKRFFDTAEQIL